MENATRGNKPGILIVDDEEAILETMTFTFEAEYEVFTSTDARRALDILDEKAPIAVVLTDQRMPGMTGVELLREIYERFPETVRIILTGFADSEATIKAINDGHIYGYTGNSTQNRGSFVCVDLATGEFVDDVDIATYDPINGRQIYVNGVFTDDPDPVPGGTLTDWDDTFAFVLGNEVSGDRQWAGVVRQVAVHNRVMTPAQIQQNFDVGVGEKFFLHVFATESLSCDPHPYHDDTVGSP